MCSMVDVYEVGTVRSEYFELVKANDSPALKYVILIILL